MFFQIVSTSAKWEFFPRETELKRDWNRVPAQWLRRFLH